MNAAELDQLLSSLNLDDCVKAFEGMPEKERKGLSERALQWMQISRAFIESAPWSNVLAQFGAEQIPKNIRAQLELVDEVKSGKILIPKVVQSQDCHDIVRLAITATAGLSDLRKLPLPSVPHAFAVMHNRKPKWLDRWLNLACERAPHCVFEMVRDFEKQGFEAEHGEGYWLSMEMSLGQKTSEDLIQTLQAEPELREEMLWKMLESESALDSLCDPTNLMEQMRRPRRTMALTDWRQWGQRIQETRRASYQWKLVLAELTRSGELPRDRVLDFIFSNLPRLSADAESKATAGNFGGELSPAGWFMAFFDELQLSAEDKSKIAERFIGLLVVKDSSTLAWAVQNLLDCPAEQLPAEDLLANLARVFYHKRKDPSLLAIKLIEQLSKQSCISNERAAEVIVEAFEHSSGEVHKKALAHLKKAKSFENHAIASAALRKIDRLSALIKKEVTELAAAAASADGQAGVEEQNSSDVSISDEELEELLLAAKSLDAVLAEKAGVRKTLEEIESSAEPSLYFAIDTMNIPRLDPSKKIKPIDNVDDLIYLYLHILEAAPNSDDIERVLDGLARLCNLRPDDFENRVSSLQKKLQPARDALNRIPPAFHPFNGGLPIIDLQAIAIAWLDSNPTPDKKPDEGFLKQVMSAFGLNQEQGGTLPQFLEDAMKRLGHATTPLSFFSERARGLAQIIAKRCPLPLLAAPTHQGGWIEPLVVPERLQQWKKAGLARNRADLIQCILRLAPEHRQEALLAMPTDADEDLRALRYALGDEMKGSITAPELWVAALRAREPRGISKMLQDKFPELGPDSATPAAFVEKMEEFRKRPDGVFAAGFMRTQSEMLPLESVPPFKARPNLRLFPLELLHEPSFYWEGSGIIEYYYPIDRESYFAYLTKRIAIFLDSQGTYWHTSWNCVFDPDLPIDGMPSWYLVLALSAKQTELFRLAMDATIAGIEEGRIDPRSFGFKLGRAFLSNKITLSRWISALKEIMRVSPVHSYFIALAAEEFFAVFPQPWNGKTPLAMVELLYDACFSCNHAVQNKDTRNFLSVNPSSPPIGTKLAKAGVAKRKFVPMP